jgi:hypothetical protein
MAGDGSMIRARLGTAADSRKLYRQRVAAPDESGDFSAWTYTGEYNAVAVAAAALGAEVSILWIKSDRSIRRIKSTDNGASFGAGELIDYSPTTACGGIAAAYKPNGDLAVFFADQSTLYIKQCVGGIWQARTAWNKSTGALSGVSCVYDGDWNLAVTGRDASGNYRLWSLVCGDGLALPAGTWGELREIAASPSAEGFDFRHAFLDKQDVYLCAYVEKFTGNEAYSRVYLASTALGAAFDAGLWTEPQPMDITGDFGVSILHSNDALWLASANSVRRAAADITETYLSDLLVASDISLGENAGRVTLELDNSGGDLPPVAIGDELEISPGYVTDSGAEASGGLFFVINRIERCGGSIIIEAADGWLRLKGWRAKNLLRWNAAAPSHSIRYITAWLLGRVGLKLEVVSSSASVTSLYPDFCLSPGAAAQAAVERLLALVPDVLFIEGGTAYLKNPLPDEASVYAYGVEHGIIACRAAASSLDINHLRLAGAGGITVEGFDFPSLSAGERYRQLSDRNLASAASLHELADTLLRGESMSAVDCEITIPPNLGQQLYDVVEVTDEASGLAAARYRVKGIGLDYRPNAGKYEMKLRLGGV